ncbi:hypothetical protein HPB49_022752 [Dermacentor silvarum]|uniref:Uncharacterized protein n=1 Tax=Dermacentor silvarum TaxID=543639 RepID=A0ACB8C5W6_DERSI|nr:hypothetical protein HPB49_022752 [Dermacentor silvarum]
MLALRTEYSGRRCTDQDADDQFKEIFESSEATAKGFGVQPGILRKRGSQKYIENQASSSPEEYYRRTCFIPYMDDMRSALTEQAPHWSQGDVVQSSTHAAELRRSQQL